MRISDSDATVSLVLLCVPFSLIFLCIHVWSYRYLSALSFWWLAYFRHQHACWLAGYLDIVPFILLLVLEVSESKGPIRLTYVYAHNHIQSHIKQIKSTTNYASTHAYAHTHICICMLCLYICKTLHIIMLRLSHTLATSSFRLGPQSRDIWRHLMGPLESSTGGPMGFRA